MTNTASRYLLSTVKPASVPDDDAAEGSTSVARPSRSTETPDARDGDAGGRKKLSKAEKKAQRGQNKGRRFTKLRDELDLCWKIANGAVCEFGAEFVSF